MLCGAAGESLGSRAELLLKLHQVDHVGVVSLEDTALLMSLMMLLLLSLLIKMMSLLVGMQIITRLTVNRQKTFGLINAPAVVITK